MIKAGLWVPRKQRSTDDVGPLGNAHSGAAYRISLENAGNDYLPDPEHIRQLTPCKYHYARYFSLIALLGLYGLLGQDYLDYLLMNLGFPFWETSVPPVVQALLSSHNLAGKLLIPFITLLQHGCASVQSALSTVLHTITMLANVPSSKTTRAFAGTSISQAFCGSYRMMAIPAVSGNCTEHTGDNVQKRSHAMIGINGTV